MIKNILRLLVSIIICQAVGILGSLVTFPAISGWYQTLNKPAFNPPNWIFGPVWTILFLLMGISLYLVWRKEKNNKNVKVALVFFATQLGFNFLWSFLFFGFQSPVAAFIDIIILWVFILLTIIKFWKISKLAAYLLLPYILWVSFAAILNLFIVVLNS